MSSKRERILARSDGTLYWQEDPFEAPVEDLLVEIGGAEVRFLYDISIVEEDEHGRPTTVAWYREEGE